MAYDLVNPLVIGISSRALFDLEEENKIFETQGLDKYEEYQIAHEKDILRKGTAFQLVKAFLNLNKLQDRRLVEVIVMSRNSPNTSLRIFNSIEEYGLDITRAALTGGAEIAPYLHAFKTDLFLSANGDDVKEAIDNDVAAGMILPGAPHEDPKADLDQIRIAFDGDAVLFSPEAERIYQQQGLEAFAESEKRNADVPLQKGPFANFLTTIGHIQHSFKDMEIAPIRTALVTSRNAPAHERAIKTLRNWNVHIDEAYFLGGVSKKEMKVSFFERFCIPAPVIGGLLFAIISCILYVTGVAVFSFDEIIRDLCMVFFFTCVGFHADMKTLKSGGKSLVLYSLCIGALIICQNIISIGLSKVLNINPLFGLGAGSISLVGGHGTSGAFGPVLEVIGLEGAATFCTAAANMQALCKQYVPSVKAFLIVPVVGGIILDFMNSILITFFINVIG